VFKEDSLECESQSLLHRSPRPSPAFFRIAASMGFLADAYDIFTIDIVLVILQLSCGKEVINVAAKSMIVAMMLAGIIIGQLTFGFVADIVGRKWAFVATAAITIVAALMSACCVNSGGTFGLPQQLCICRFFLGFGVGGEYPLSAAVTAESTDDIDERRLSLAKNLSMQGWGMLLSSLLAVLAITIGLSMEVAWRLLLAFGAIPSMFAFFLRLQLHETAAFKESKKVAKTNDSYICETWNEILNHKRTLFGTASSWLIMNISLYSMGSFKSTIFAGLMPSTGLDDRDKILRSAGFSAITSTFAIVGFMAALWLINRIGCFVMQLQGFIMIGGIFFLLSFVDTPLVASMILLGSTFFFQNMGPNTTTFVIPAEAFPTRVRATCHGISAASGKVGAVIGTSMFPVVQGALGDNAVYLICGVTAFVGAAVTVGFTPRQAAAG